MRFFFNVHRCLWFCLPQITDKTSDSEHYDIHDPFIDDPELALDERAYFAQGFYVPSGEVALPKDEFVRCYLLTGIARSFDRFQDTQEPKIKDACKDGRACKAEKYARGYKGPMALGSDDEDARAGQKRKRYTMAVENGKKRCVVNIVSVKLYRTFFILLC
jgi:hypothetical protein